MEFTNFCKRLGSDEIKAIYGYAKRLEASECVIHKNGSISLYCPDGCICENYIPTRKELYR